jgi:hypothetical protein
MKNSLTEKPLPMLKPATHPILILLFLPFFGCQPAAEALRLTCGAEQNFKYRHEDINILGTFSGIPKEVTYQLNGGATVDFYIKGMDPEKDKVSRNRLFREGDFNIEIPVNSEDLQAGQNQLEIEIIDTENQPHRKEVIFAWDPEPVALPLELSNLAAYSNVQQLGQIVNGAFEIDHEKNVIRTSQPVAKDVLLLLGSPFGSQEATYSVVFGGESGNFLGLADFFAGHEESIPAIGIKPGWSSAGLATIRPDQNQSAQTWLAWGDLLEDKRKWVVKTDPPKPFEFQVGLKYRVRQQVLFQNGVNRARFRIWPEGTEEPEDWLCEESDENVPENQIKFETASFGLFQFGGQPTEWSDIRLVGLN